MATKFRWDKLILMNDFGMVIVAVEPMSRTHYEAGIFNWSSQRKALRCLYIQERHMNTVTSKVNSDSKMFVQQVEKLKQENGGSPLEGGDIVKHVMLPKDSIEHEDLLDYEATVLVFHEEHVVEKPSPPASGGGGDWDSWRHTKPSSTQPEVPFEQKRARECERISKGLAKYLETINSLELKDPTKNTTNYRQCRKALKQAMNSVTNLGLNEVQAA